MTIDNDSNNNNNDQQQTTSSITITIPLSLSRAINFFNSFLPSSLSSKASSSSSHDYYYDGTSTILFLVFITTLLLFFLTTKSRKRDNDGTTTTNTTYPRSTSQSSSSSHNNRTSHHSSSPRATKNSNNNTPNNKPFIIHGPTTTTITYYVSTPPDDNPNMFSTLRYQSIHRKLVIDVPRLMLKVHCPLLNHDEGVFEERDFEEDLYKDNDKKGGGGGKGDVIFPVREIPLETVTNVTVVPKSSSSDSGRRRHHDNSGGALQITLDVPLHHHHQHKKKQSSTTVPTTSETLEYNFLSPSEAASFQNTILRLCIGGRWINNLYTSLELIHRHDCRLAAAAGSGTTITSSESDANRRSRRHGGGGGVALDDCLQCLSHLSSVHCAYRTCYPPTKTNGSSGYDSLIASAAEDDNHDDDEQNEERKMRRQRVEIGPVDFFNFLVMNDDDDLHQKKEDHHPSRTPKRKQISHYHNRLQQLLSWRVLLGQTALRVLFYIRGVQMAQEWWSSSSCKNTIRRRFPFDLDKWNVSYDQQVSNCYYEGLVGRDVRLRACRRRKNDDDDGELLPHHQHHGQQHGYRGGEEQAFKLVFCQIYETTTSENNKGLRPGVDPVLAVPMLKRFLEEYQQQGLDDDEDGGGGGMEFFVCALLYDLDRWGLLAVFVRVLPRGVDREFDRTWDQYKRGNDEHRNSHLQLFLQFGPGSIVPLFWSFLKVINFVRSWRDGREHQQHQQHELFTYDAETFSHGGYVPIPGIRFGHTTQIHHYTGKNYTSLTSQINRREKKTFGLEMRAIDYLLRVAVPERSVDFTFALWGRRSSGDDGGDGDGGCGGEHKALGTCRLVRVHPRTIAVKLDDYATSSDDDDDGQGGETTATVETNHDDNTTLTNDNDDDDNASQLNQEQQTRDQTTIINALRKILADVTIPTTRPPLVPTLPNNTTITTLSRPVLSYFTDTDLLRFYNTIHTTATNNNHNHNQSSSSSSLKKTTTKLIQTAQWHAQTFPINAHHYQIEIHSRQFLRHGYDLFRNKLFYLRVMLRGRWRGDVDASLMAFLWRWERELKGWDGRCTIVMVMGVPVTKEEENEMEDGGEEGGTNQNETTIVDNNDDNNKEMNQNETTTANNSNNNNSIYSYWNTLSQTDDYDTHANMILVKRIRDILSTHYPDRLAHMLIVPETTNNNVIEGQKKKKRARNNIMHGSSSLPSSLSLGGLRRLLHGTAGATTTAATTTEMKMKYKKLRHQFKILTSWEDLKDYIDDEWSNVEFAC